jgi:hypothetical protein
MIYKLMLAFIAMTFIGIHVKGYHSVNFLNGKIEKFIFNCTGVDCGCLKGYCWSQCTRSKSILNGSFGMFGWCYTTKGWENKYQKISCSKNEDCQDFWNCPNYCYAIKSLTSNRNI